MEPVQQNRSRSLSKPRPVYKRDSMVQSQMQGHVGQQVESVVTSKGDFAKLIETKYKTYTWDKTFDYFKLDTSRLRSLFLVENSDFQTCIFLVEQYNKQLEEFQLSQRERERNKEKPGELKNGPWKMRFYSTLVNVLKEVVKTPDKVVQRIFAKEVHDWAIQEIEGIEADQKKLRIFDGDPAFLSCSFQAMAKDFMSLNSVRLVSPFKSKHGSRSQSSRGQNNNVSFSTSINLEPIVKQNGAAGSVGNSVSDTSYAQSARELGGHDNSTRDNTRILESLKEDGEEFDKSGNVLTGANSGGAIFYKSNRMRMKQPSEIAAEELADYEICARTKHSEYEPPNIRLKEFKRRVLSFDQPKKFDQNGLTNAANNEDKSVFAGIVYPKPISFKEMKRRKEEEEKAARKLEEEEEERLRREELVDGPGVGAAAVPSAAGEIVEGANEPNEAVKVEGGENIEGGKNLGDDGDGDDDNGEIIVGLEVEEKDVKPPLQPNIKNFIDDVVSKEKYVRDLNSRFDQRSDFVAYEPTKDEREIRMENKWMEGRQRELKEKRENEEMIKIMGEYSLAKGRIEREINRKIDSNIFGSKFRDCEYRFARKSAMEMRVLDTKTKEVAARWNALEEIQAAEAKLKLVEVKKKEREERRGLRQERAEKRLNKEKKLANKPAGGFNFSNDDSDDDVVVVGGGVHGKKVVGKGAAAAGDSGEDSFDEDLDGPLSLENPIVKARPRLQKMYWEQQKSKPVNNVDFQVQLPMIHAKTKRSISNPLRGLELDSRRQKIMDIANQHGKFIGVNLNEKKESSDAMNSSRTETGDGLQQASTARSNYLMRMEEQTDSEITQVKGLSIYSRDVQQKLRPFSAIFDHYDIEEIQSGQLAEVANVKNRMAKYKISLPYKQLKDAMIVPEGFTDEQDLEELPEPGQGLFKNPFMKEKKKKKKKKKRS